MQKKLNEAPLSKNMFIFAVKKLKIKIKPLFIS